MISSTRVLVIMQIFYRPLSTTTIQSPTVFSDFLKFSSGLGYLGNGKTADSPPCKTFLRVDYPKYLIGAAQHRKISSSPLSESDY